MITVFHPPGIVPSRAIISASKKPESPVTTISKFLNSIFEAIGRLFSPSHAPKALQIQWKELPEDGFLLIEGKPTSKPVNGLLEGLKNVFKSAFTKTVMETVLSTPLKGRVNLNLSNAMTASAELKFADKVTCNMTLSLAPDASNKEKEELKELHPLLTALLDKSITSKLKSMDQLQELIQAFPLQQTSLEWKGSEHKASLNLTLPGNAHLKVDLDFPADLSSLSDDIPPALRALIPEAAYEIFPGIKPLLSENFRFEWNGMTSKFALDFESRQVINLTNLELKGNALMKMIGGFLGHTLKINLPQRIAGKIDPQTLSIQFEEETSFKVKIKKLERVGKMVDLENIQFDKAGNKINLRIKCFGLHLKAVIDLNTSMIDRKAFKFVTKADSKRPYAQTILDIPAPIDSKSPNKHLEGIKATLRKLIPATYLPLFDIFLSAKTDGNLDFNLEDKSIGATFNLADEVTCKANIKFPIGTDPIKGIELNQQLLETLKTKLKPKVGEQYNIDEIIALLLTLPHGTTSLNWEGSKGKATVTMQLPGGALFTVELSAPTMIGKGITAVPPTMEKILSQLLFKEMFTSIKPFLSSDFALTWNGETSEFSVKFKDAQQLHIQSIKLPQGGVLSKLANFVAGNSFVKLPSEIKGKINLKDLSVEFSPKISFNLKSGIVRKEFDLRKIQYSPENQKLKIDFNFFGSHSETIDLSPKKTTKPKGEVELKFSVGPVPKKN